ncbi:MAG TPA: AI-2E family transporter [Solirubrobacteraceae bacterium]
MSDIPQPAAAELGPEPGSRSAAIVATAARVVAVVVVAVLGLYLVYLLRKPLGWLVLAGFIAVAVSGPVRFFERWLRRGLAITVVYLAVILIPFLIAGVLVPPIVDQANNLATNAPQYARDLTKTVQENKTLHDLDKKYDLTVKIEEQAAKLPAKVGDAAGVLASVGASIVSSVFAGITILILSVFMVGAAPRWRRAFVRLHDDHTASALNRLFDRTGNAVGGYVRGALLQAVIAGVSSWIVLEILGVPYPVALALIIALLDLVPLVGATLGAIVVGIVTLFNDFPTATIVWAIWSVVYQQIENTVIQPRIQSRAVQVEPFVVLVAVLFGSTLFGVFGALLAIPAAATLQIAIYEYTLYRRQRLAEDADEEPPPDPPPDPAGGPEPAPVGA